MEIVVNHPAFKTTRLAVEPAGFFTAPRLLVNGSVVSKQKGHYSIVSDSGAETIVELRHNFFDPVPKMKIGTESIQLARSFKWYEYTWFVFLVLGMYQAHPVGGLIGALAAVVSARVFRHNYSAPEKLGLLALIFVGAFVVAAIAIALLTVVAGTPQK